MIVGFGGGCHWCTEAVFESLNGVIKVEQGWIASVLPNDSFSEAVRVTYDPEVIDLTTLISIHLRTHSSTSNHSMRDKYRSAIYTISKKDMSSAKKALELQQLQFEKTIVTQVLPLDDFKGNQEKYLHYFAKNAGNGFCERYIDPKIEMLSRDFSKYVK